MFEGLKTLVNKENLQKIKANQRYLSGEHSNNHSVDSSPENSNEDDINDRIHVFNRLTNSCNQNEERHYFHRDHEREQMRKLQKEINILQEKIRIEQQLHERQIQNLKDQHRIQIQTLKLQMEKYENTIRRGVKEQGLVNSLRKDIKRFAGLHEQDQKTLEKATHQLASTKKQVLQLKIIIKKKEQAQAEQQAYRYIESSAQTRLKQEIANLQQEKARQHQKKKQLQLLIQRLRSEKDDLEREIDASRHQFSHEVSIIEEKFKAQITRLEDDNRDLKKRNQTIQESFIDHLTQTSLNLQQNLKAIPERSFKNNSSLYLQASPIRGRSKDHHAQDKDLSDDDPQKKDHQTGKLKNQVNKLRQKLEQANEKIVELLRQKCTVQRKPPVK